MEPGLLVTPLGSRVKDRDELGWAGRRREVETYGSLHRPRVDIQC